MNNMPVRLYFMIISEIASVIFFLSVAVSDDLLTFNIHHALSLHQIYKFQKRIKKKLCETSLQLTSFASFVMVVVEVARDVGNFAANPYTACGLHAIPFDWRSHIKMP